MDVRLAGDTGGAEHWLRAARDAEVAAGLETIFNDARAAIEARGPACWASGRCCNFERAGHLLYTTALEAAYTLARRPPTGPSLGAALLPQIGGDDRAPCPFQAGNLCGVHEIKPVACRVYFCDRSAQEWQRDLSERLHERVRDLHTRCRIEYRYDEWRRLLAMLSGR